MRTLSLLNIYYILYLPEYKSQLQHLFLLLISRVRLILRMLRILRSISRTESETSPYGRGRERWCSACVNIQVKYAHDGACMLESEDGEADELL